MSYSHSGAGYNSLSFHQTAFQAALDRERARNLDLENQLRQARRANDTHWLRHVFRTALTLIDPTGIVAIGIEHAFDWLIDWWETRL